MRYKLAASTGVTTFGRVAGLVLDVTLEDTVCSSSMGKLAADRSYGKRTRIEGDDGTWPTGQLVVGSARLSQSERNERVLTLRALPSPNRMLPPPSGLPAECIFKDQQTGAALELV